MGTLTADVPRLAEYCNHKLPSSCRLSSIPECCACADERAHAPSYSVYIDGVGFVPRGTRWQRYCWFCKEFWENRVKASGLRPAQTRIPEVPDQQAFLDRWYDFYNGYRIVMKEDGTQERVAVLGEPFKDVSPGELPRTIEELRAGREREIVGRVDQDDPSREEEVGGPSLDDALQQMLDETPESDPRVVTTRASEDRGSVTATATAAPRSAQAMVPAGSHRREYQARRAAALRRELRRMRNGIERVIIGLRELGENVPDHREASSRLATLGQTLDAIAGVPSQDDRERAIDSVTALAQASNTTQSDRTLAAIQSRVDAARQHFDEARRSRDQAAAELDLAETDYQTSQQTLQQLQREQRSTENYIRLFGTREEMIAQGENYESPIGAMFSRAYERFQVAEDVRREQTTLRQVLEDEVRARDDVAAQRLAELDSRERDVWGVPRSSQQQRPQQQSASNTSPPATDSALEQYQSLVRTQERNMDNLGGHVFQRNNVETEEPSLVSQEQEESVADIWFDEVEQMLLHLESDSFSRNPWSMAPADVRAIRERLMEQALTDSDRAKIEEMRQSGSLLMRAGLITARVQRRRAAGEHVTFLGNPTNTVEAMQNVEMMAEAFQMSSRVRLLAHGLPSPQRLMMLYRLQAGQRNSEEDIVSLEWLVDQPDAIEIARRVHTDTLRGLVSPEARRRIDALRRSRQALADRGDHSREELDMQRRATSAVAGAAARIAMQAGPRVLLERMADQDPETRAAYQRLQENGFDAAASDLPTQFRTLTLSDFVSDSEDDSDKENEAQGLDAPDTGRPEPREDEEMTVRLDCRICYSQVAEIACLPCGHLVMCKWCSEQHSPTMPHDRTRPRRAAGCPVCRKNVRQKVRVFRA